MWNDKIFVAFNFKMRKIEERKILFFFKNFKKKNLPFLYFSQFKKKFKESAKVITIMSKKSFEERI